ncbi:MAG: reverse transcriptase N-terminal domain-containing protein [Euryarchaeota archaeon]|nr:reverse transcriptase N-terminal domain-containing protein [Euryarchaeota archaeon]
MLTPSQTRITKAVKQRKWYLVKRLQYLLTNSFYAKLLAVRRVTQNKGKKTAGIDGAKWITPNSKMNAVLKLSNEKYKATPLRRVYIPKPGTTKKLPLSIPMERGVLDFVLAKKQPLNAREVSGGMGDRYSSLRHKTHASSVLNSLVSKGSLGKIKIRPSYYFTTPEEAVIECLKRRGEEPDRCSSVRIAGETGVPLAVVLEEIGGLLGSE